MTKKRYKLGFLFGDFYGAYTANLFYNIVKSCREYGQNLICFGGGFLKSPGGSVLGENCNFIFDLPGKENIDGLIVEGSIGNFIPKKDMQEFLLKYSGIPIVNLQTNLEGVTNILIDNKKGMEGLVTHLVEYHNYKKIAFIAGTEGNFDAIERFEAYKNVLQKHDIGFDEALVANGNFSYMDATKAFETLVERKVKFEAIVCANDYMAISIIREMEKRGLSIPAFSAITGFDDTEESWTTTPPLTTVKQPFYEIGRESVKALVSILDGKKIGGNIIIPTEFIIRESCGCRVVDKLNHIMNEKFVKNIQIKNLFNMNDRTCFVSDLNAVMDKELPFIKKKINKWLNDLINAYCEIKAGGDKNRLFDIFLGIFGYLVDSNEEIITINQFVSIFYGNLVNQLAEASERENCLRLWNETLALFGLMIKEDLSEKRAALKLESHNVFDINESFINTFNIVKLKEAILNNLPNFHFKCFFACLFEDITRNTSRILVAYDEEKKNISYEPFPSKYLIPSKIDKAGAFEYVVMALNFKDEYFGYILYDMQTLTSFIYETLSVNISGAIKGALLTNELYEYATQLENKVKERTFELEKANAKLKELDALKNDFIANITHDFRSPLTVILNAADLAIRFDDRIDEEEKEKFRMIYKSSLRLKDTIDKLLELAKIDARGIKLRIEKVDPVSCFNTLLEYYESSVSSSGIKIIKKLPRPGIDNFYTDVEKLEEILDNILSNAVKFVDPNTGIIDASLEEKGDDIIITISDNGIGIPREKLSIIFNRFEQLHEPRNSLYHGTGIGLAFSKQLTDFLKGELWAESEGEGKGATFILRLKKGREHFNDKDMTSIEPAYRKRRDIKTLIEAELEEKLHNETLKTIFTDLNKDNESDYRKGIILIIDDDKTICDIIYRYLLNNGFKNFIIASDGKQGLEAVYDYSPDIVICDFNMPNMKGDDLHNRLLGNPLHKEIPFIFLSAVADEGLMLERRELGAAAYLKKPIEEKLLIITVEEQLKKYYELKKIKQLATKDELTGLNNHKAILDNLKRELSVRINRDISVIFLDIDNFKEINENYGHQAGDMLLSTTGRLIKSSIRKYDLAGRFGGDEFLIILPDTDMASALYVAEVLRKTISIKKIVYGKDKLSYTSSFGVASLQDNSEYIGKTLGIENLKELYNVRDSEKADWDSIEKNKERIADLLFKMAYEALFEAKRTKCGKCGFNSEKVNGFPGNKCPECGNEDISIGRNRVVKFG